MSPRLYPGRPPDAARRSRPAWDGMSCAWVTYDSSDARSLLASHRVFFAHGPGTRNLKTLMRNLPLAWRIIRELRPAVILSTGAALAVPFAWIGRMLGAEVVYVESLTRIESVSLSYRLLLRSQTVDTCNGRSWLGEPGHATSATSSRSDDLRHRRYEHTAVRSPPGWIASFRGRRRRSSLSSTVRRQFAPPGPSALPSLATTNSWSICAGLARSSRMRASGRSSRPGWWVSGRSSCRGCASSARRSTTISSSSQGSSTGRPRQAGCGARDALSPLGRQRAVVGHRPENALVETCGTYLLETVAGPKALRRAHAKRTGRGR